MGLSSFLRLNNQRNAPTASAAPIANPEQYNEDRTRFDYESDSPPYSPTLSEMERPILPPQMHQELWRACANLVHVTHAMDEEDHHKSETLANARNVEANRKAKEAMHRQRRRRDQEKNRAEAQSSSSSIPAKGGFHASHYHTWDVRDRIPRTDPEASAVHVESVEPFAVHGRRPTRDVRVPSDFGDQHSSISADPTRHDRYPLQFMPTHTHVREMPPDKSTAQPISSEQVTRENLASQRSASTAQASSGSKEQLRDNITDDGASQIHSFEKNTPDLVGGTADKITTAAGHQVILRKPQLTNTAALPSVQTEIQELARQRADEYTARRNGQPPNSKPSRPAHMASSSNLTEEDPRRPGVSRASSFASSIASGIGHYLRPRTSRDTMYRAPSRQRSASNQSQASTSITSPSPSRPDSRASNHSNMSTSSSWWRSGGLRTRSSWASLRNQRRQQDGDDSDSGVSRSTSADRGRFSRKKHQKSDEPNLNRPLPALPGLDQYRETKTHIGQLMSRRARRDRDTNTPATTKVKKSKIGVPQPLLPVDTPYTATLPLEVQKLSVSALAADMPEIRSAPLLGTMKPATDSKFAPSKSVSYQYDSDNPQRGDMKQSSADLWPLNSDTKPSLTESSGGSQAQSTSMTSSHVPSLLLPSISTPVKVTTAQATIKHTNLCGQTYYEQIQARQNRQQQQVILEDQERLLQVNERRNLYSPPPSDEPLLPRTHSPARSQSTTDSVRRTFKPPAFSVKEFRAPNFSHSATFPIMTPQMLSPRSIPVSNGGKAGYGFPAPPSINHGYHPQQSENPPRDIYEHNLIKPNYPNHIEADTRAQLQPRTQMISTPLSNLTNGSHSGQHTEIFSPPPTQRVQAHKAANKPASGIPKTTSKSFQYPRKKGMARSPTREHLNPNQDGLGSISEPPRQMPGIPTNTMKLPPLRNSVMPQMIPVRTSAMSPPPPPHHPPPIVRGPSYLDEIEAGVYSMP